MVEQATHAEPLLQPDGFFEQARLDETLVFKAGSERNLVEIRRRKHP
jgi:hypothetical protein